MEGTLAGTDIEPASPSGHGLTPLRALSVLAAFLAGFVAAALLIWNTYLVTGAVDLEGLISGDLALRVAVRGRLLGPVLGLIFAVLVARPLAGPTFWGPSRTGVGLATGLPRHIAVGVALGLPLGMVSGALTSTPWPELSPSPDELRRALLHVGSMAASLLVVSPLAEEFLFRGVLFSGLARRFAVQQAAVATTALSIALHFPFAGQLLLVHTTIASLLMAVRIRSRALGPCVATHFAYNLGLLAVAASPLLDYLR